MFGANTLRQPHAVRTMQSLPSCSISCLVPPLPQQWHVQGPEAKPRLAGRVSKLRLENRRPLQLRAASPPAPQRVCKWELPTGTVFARCRSLLPFTRRRPNHSLAPITANTDPPNAQQPACLPPWPQEPGGDSAVSPVKSSAPPVWGVLKWPPARAAPSTSISQPSAAMLSPFRHGSLAEIFPVQQPLVVPGPDALQTSQSTRPKVSARPCGHAGRK